MSIAYLIVITLLYIVLYIGTRRRGNQELINVLIIWQVLIIVNIIFDTIGHEQSIDGLYKAVYPMALSFFCYLGKDLFKKK